MLVPGLPTRLQLRRFKRVGPNAMRGRGIGTARGRATIMRGAYLLGVLAPRPRTDQCMLLSYLLCRVGTIHLSSANGGYPLPLSAPLLLSEDFTDGLFFSLQF